MTEYKILFRDEEKWSEGYPNVKASSPRAAIRAALDGNDQEGGEFVAVPARSWHPVKVAVETALKFS